MAIATWLPLVTVAAAVGAVVAVGAAVGAVVAVGAVAAAVELPHPASSRIRMDPRIRPGASHR